MPYQFVTDSDGSFWIQFIQQQEETMPSRWINCHNCGDTIDRDYDDYNTDDDGSHYCCDECMPGYGESCTCSACRPRRSGNGVIHPYSYRPRRYNSKGNFPTEVLMGVELEVGGQKYDIANRVAEVDGDESTLYCKDDCSIWGTEIVSHPFTLNWVKTWGGYDRLLDLLREDECFAGSEECGRNGCGSGAYCDHSFGLHIHVSRNAFKQLRKRRSAPEPPAENETYEQRIGRELRAIQRQQREQEAINHQMIWLMFLERNSDQLSGDNKLARRESERWGAFKHSDINELRAKGQDYAYHGENRYMAINCQNEKTYELRFFKSTVDTEEFYAALEFADASVEFTRNIEADAVLRGRALAWPNFVGWINEQKTETDNGVVMKYANLISQINTLGL